MAQETVIVTGGAGYIGSHTIIEMLGSSNCEVASIDNFSRSDPSTYARVKEITGKNVLAYDFDLCDAKALKEAFPNPKDISGIIHFAAYKSVPESVRDPLGYYRNNLVSLMNLLDFCRVSGIRNFIFSSSCSVYGNADELPVTELSPVKQAESPYGHTKQVSEEIIRFFCEANPDFKAVSLRYFNPVGAHMSGRHGELPVSKPDNLVPIITQTASGKNSLTVYGNNFPTRDGYCIRDYIHVSDIASAHLKALEWLQKKSHQPNYSVFNLGTGKGVSVMEAIRSFEKVSGTKLPFKIGEPRQGDVVAVYADNTKARKELGWEPEHSLDDMMLSAWKWQQHLNDAEKD
jgi:UDP-glucose 4-epimerase